MLFGAFWVWLQGMLPPLVVLESIAGKSVQIDINLWTDYCIPKNIICCIFLTCDLYMCVFDFQTVSMSQVFFFILCYRCAGFPAAVCPRDLKVSGAWTWVLNYKDSNLRSCKLVISDAGALIHLISCCVLKIFSFHRHLEEDSWKPVTLFCIIIILHFATCT